MRSAGVETGRVSYAGVRSLPPSAAWELPTIEPQTVHMRPGPGGWMLSEFEWDPDTGRAVLDYERVNLATGQLEARREFVSQPYHPAHRGW